MTCFTNSLFKVYVMHRQDRLLLSQLRLASLQFGWNKEPKRLEVVLPIGARYLNSARKIGQDPIWHVRPRPIRGLPAIEPLSF